MNRLKTQYKGWIIIGLVIGLFMGIGYTVNAIGQTSVPIAPSGGYFLTSTSTGNWQATSSPTFSNLTATGTITAQNLTVLGTCTNCGSGSGFSTTSADFWFIGQVNPFLTVAALTSTSTATSTFAGGIRLTGGLSSTLPIEAPSFIASSSAGTSTFSGPIKITAQSGSNYSPSVSAGGILNLTNTNSSGAGAVFFTNHGAGATGRLAVFNCAGASFDQDCVVMQGLADNTNNTVLNIQASSTGKGGLKVEEKGNANPNASAISIDVVGNSAQGLFINSTGSSTGNLLTGHNHTGGLDFFNFSSVGWLGIGTTTAGSPLSITGITNFTTATSTFYSNGGINLSNGCFAVGGVCVGVSSVNGFSTTSANYWLIGQVNPSLTVAAIISTSTATSTFAGGIDTKGIISSNTYISAPYFRATSTIATSTFANDISARFIQINTYHQYAEIFGLDPSTGVGFDGPGILSLHTGGVNRVYINGLGNLGIATSGPYARLSVEGSSVLGNLAIAGYYIATSTTATSTFAGGLSITGGGLKVGTLPSCSSTNALTTDALGNVICGAISGTGGGSDPFTHPFIGASATTSVMLSASASTTGATEGGGQGGVTLYNMGAGTGTLGFNSLGYAAGVAGYGALFQLAPSTGAFSMFLESNVSAGVQHAHTQTLGWDSTGVVTLNQGLITPSYTTTGTASSTMVGGLQAGLGSFWNNLETKNLFATGTAYIQNLTVLSQASAGCATFSSAGVLTSTGSACGAPFDWKQTTLSPFGVNVLTPTTTIPIWIQSTATSTFAGDVTSDYGSFWSGLETPFIFASSTSATSTIKSPLLLDAGISINSNFLNITASRKYPPSITTGGMVHIDNSTVNGGTALEVVSGFGAGASGRAIVFNETNSAFDQDFILASSSAANTTALNIKGLPTGKGILKIEHTGNGTGFTNSSALSIDLLLASDAQGIFIKGATNGSNKLLNVVDSNSSTLFNVDSLGNSTTTGFIDVNAKNGTATSTFKGGLLGKFGTFWNGLEMPWFKATSTTATSSVAGGFSIFGGGLNIATLLNCQSGSALQTDTLGNVICAAVTGGTGRTKTTQVEIPFSDCTPEATSTRFFVGGAFFEPMVLSDSVQFTPMAMDFSYSTSSAMNCVWHIPSDYSSGLALTITQIVSTSTSKVAVLDMDATSTPAILGSIGAPQNFVPIWNASTTAGQRITTTGTVGVATSTIAIPITGTGINLIAGDDLLFRLTRWGANAADTLGADLLVGKLYMSYTTK